MQAVPVRGRGCRLQAKCRVQSAECRVQTAACKESRFSAAVPHAIMPCPWCALPAAALVWLLEPGIPEGGLRLHVGAQLGGRVSRVGRVSLQLMRRFGFLDDGKITEIVSARMMALPHLIGALDLDY